MFLCCAELLLNQGGIRGRSRQLGEPNTRFLDPREQALNIGRSATQRIFNRSPTGMNLRQALRIRVKSAQIGRHVISEGIQLECLVAGAGDEISHGLVEARGLVQLRVCTARGLYRTRIVATIIPLQITERSPHQGAKILNIRQARGLPHQVLFFAWLRIKRLDLIDSRTQIVDLLGTLRRVATQGIKAMLDINGCAKSCAILLQDSPMFAATKLIQRTSLSGLPRQPNLIRLTMDRHHRPDDIGQYGSRNGTGTKVRTRAPRCTDRPTNNQLIAFNEATSVLHA